MVSEEVIDEVINYTGKQFQEALKDSNSLEMSGFGKLVFNRNRAKKELNKMEELIKFYTEKLLLATTDKEIQNLKSRLRTATDLRDYLKTKLNE